MAATGLSTPKSPGDAGLHQQKWEAISTDYSLPHASANTALEQGLPELSPTAGTWSSDLCPPKGVGFAPAVNSRGLLLPGTCRPPALLQPGWEPWLDKDEQLCVRVFTWGTGSPREPQSQAHKRVIEKYSECLNEEKMITVKDA